MFMFYHKDLQYAVAVVKLIPTINTRSNSWGSFFSGYPFDNTIKIHNQ